MKWIKWNENQLRNWEKKRQKGKSHVIWFYGVACWGTWMFVAMSIFNYIHKFGFNWGHLDEYPIYMLIFYAMVWTVGGYCWGTAMWSVMENSYLKHRREHPADGE